MTNALRIATAVALMVVAMSGCSGAPGTTRTAPIAEPLEGPFPVGRWLCIDDVDFERYRQSNTGWATLRLDRIICNVFGSGLTTGLEVLPDGSGWTLRIQRIDLYYDRGREFRWSYDGGELLIQTRSNNVLTVDKVTDDVVRIVTRFNRRHLLFRIGAPAFVRLDQFLECVENNYNRSLFEVVDCGAPPDTGRP